MWCKRNNLELGTHAPMMIHIPGVTDHGIQTQNLVEFVDLFPTLVEAAGLPQLPLCQRSDCTAPNFLSTCREGMSILPLIDNPNIKQWRKYAFSQLRAVSNRTPVLGHAVRESRYRYVEWFKFNKLTNATDFSSSVAVELYDHKRDPDELRNVANEDKYAEAKEKLSAVVKRGWWEMENIE